MNIDFRPEKIWNMVSIAAVLLMGFLVVYDNLVPKAKPQDPSVHTANKNEANIDIRISTKALQESKAELTKLVWTQPADSIGPIAMSTASRLAAAQGLRLVAFRPQRTAEEEGVQRLAYLIAVEGSFPKIMGFLEKLETPTNKLAVNLVQVASADGASDNVNATIGVVAYRQQDGEPNNASTR